MRYLLYKVTDLRNGMIYVGQTSKPIGVRWSQHIKDSRGRCKCRRIANAIRKYGPENFTIEQIEECASREEANRREVYWIEKLQTLSPKGYNLTGGGLANEISEETRRLISASKMGDKNPSRIYPYGEERRQRQSESMRGDKNFRFGKKHTKESIEKIIATKTPKVRQKASDVAKALWAKRRAEGISVFTPEVRRKLSDSLKGRQFSDEHYRKLCLKNRERSKRRPPADLQPSLL